MKMKKQSCAERPASASCDSIRFSRWLACELYRGLLMERQTRRALGGLIALLGWQPAIRSKSINEQHGLRKVLCRPPIEPKQYARCTGATVLFQTIACIRNIIIMYALHPMTEIRNIIIAFIYLFLPIRHYECIAVGPWPKELKRRSTKSSYIGSKPTRKGRCYLPIQAAVNPPRWYIVPSHWPL